MDIESGDVVVFDTARPQDRDGSLARELWLPASNLPRRDRAAGCWETAAWQPTRCSSRFSTRPRARPIPVFHSRPFRIVTDVARPGSKTALQRARTRSSSATKPGVGSEAYRRYWDRLLRCTRAPPAFTCYLPVKGEAGPQRCAYDSLSRPRKNRWSAGRLDMEEALSRIVNAQASRRFRRRLFVVWDPKGAEARDDDALDCSRAGSTLS